MAQSKRSIKSARAAAGLRKRIVPQMTEKEFQQLIADRKVKEAESYERIVGETKD